VIASRDIDSVQVDKCLSVIDSDVVNLMCSRVDYIVSPAVNEISPLFWLVF